MNHQGYCIMLLRLEGRVAERFIASLTQGLRDRAEGQILESVLWRQRGHTSICHTATLRNKF